MTGRVHLALDVQPPERAVDLLPDTGWSIWASLAGHGPALERRLDEQPRPWRTLGRLSGNDQCLGHERDGPLIAALRLPVGRHPHPQDVPRQVDVCLFE